MTGYIEQDSEVGFKRKPLPKLKLAPRVPKKPKKPKSLTPLQKFRLQTISKRKDLKIARKKIDQDLKAIERDLGVLKRPKAPKAAPFK